jgi:uncharacterized membrane protein YeaQ/YmgE (transglycosylase-associated protein family)
MNVVAFLVIGVLAGWISGKIMRGRGFGLLRNLIVGVLGALAGGLLFGLLGLEAHGFIGSLVTAVAGAVLLLYILKKA